MTKSDFLDFPQFIEEAHKITQIAMNPNRSTTGPATWTNPRTSATYSVPSGGELALAKKIRDDRIAVFGVLDIVTDLNKKTYGSKGTTAQRPILTANDSGYIYYDETLGMPIWWNGSAWKDAEKNGDVSWVLAIMEEINKKANGSKGTTAQRPVLVAGDNGFMYYDTTLSKPVWWDGTEWKDAAGETA